MREKIGKLRTMRLRAGSQSPFQRMGYLRTLLLFNSLMVAKGFGGISFALEPTTLVLSLLSPYSSCLSISICFNLSCV